MAVMTEWLEVIMGMSNLGYVLLLNTCGNIVFTHNHCDNTLTFKTWGEVANYVNLHKQSL